MSVLDQIYEAAFVPDQWPDVLGRIAELSSSYSGALLIIDPKLPPMFASTPNIADSLAEFAKTPHWYTNAPAHRLRKLGYPGGSDSQIFSANMHTVKASLKYHF
ncbi:hypothetical protein [Devosia soli]|nr:hypothetical protein [Devosia soli]